MNTNMKILSTQYSARHKSLCKVQHLGHFFYGEARLNPEDAEKESMYTGGNIAHCRAIISALKYEKEIKKEELRQCENFVKSVLSHKQFDGESMECKLMMHQLGVRRKIVAKLDSEITKLESGIDSYLEKKERLLENMESQKEFSNALRGLIEKVELKEMDGEIPSTLPENEMELAALS